MSSIPKSRAWIVAAGTGGHIFPGLNLAVALEKALPQLDFLFFGTRDRLEAKIIPAHNRRIRFLSAGRWKGSGPMARLGGLVSIAGGFCQALGEAFKQRPQFLVSVGGYVSVPVALACFVMRIPVFLLEPNIRAGLANRLLSRFVRAAYTVKGSDASRVFKCRVFEFGNPVRCDLGRMAIREKVRRVLVLGGSQGALTLCRVMLELAQDALFQRNGIDVFVQTGEKNLEQAREWQVEFDVAPWTQVAPFINNVPEALGLADVVVARAGAMTLSELAVAGLPTVLVPFPFAADDHQRVNARLLADDGAALVADEKDPAFHEKLKKHLADLCFSPQQRALRTEMSQKFQAWGRPSAGDDIAQSVLSISGLKG